MEYIRHKHPFVNEQAKLGNVLTRIMREHFDDQQVETEAEANDFDVTDPFDDPLFGLTKYEVQVMVDDHLKGPSEDLEPALDESDIIPSDRSKTESPKAKQTPPDAPTE